jgi:hypothetical protein
MLEKSNDNLQIGDDNNVTDPTKDGMRVVKAVPWQERTTQQCV